MNYVICLGHIVAWKKLRVSGLQYFGGGLDLFFFGRGYLACL